MVDDSEKMLKNVARKMKGPPSLIGSLLLVSCCSYIIFKHFKKRKKEVIVISRYPEAGKAKTRLIPCLGEPGAAQLQVFMVYVYLLIHITMSSHLALLQLQFRASLHI